MKKIVAFVGSGRKWRTQQAAERFVDDLKALGEYDCEIVRLSDHRLETCRGCKRCFEKGEEFCILKDDRDTLFGKIESADGIVFATPNYTFHVSGHMKVFLDRFGYACHRPCYFGKASTAIVTQGFYGGKKILKYYDFVAKALGFNTVKGCETPGLEEMSPQARKKFDAALADLAARFHRRLQAPAFPSPGLVKLFLFRWARTSMGILLDEKSRDWRYYKDKGWFESDYYYPVRMGPFKKATGSIFDWVGGRLAKKM